jgi:hypothetical protein
VVASIVCASLTMQNQLTSRVECHR